MHSYSMDLGGRTLTIEAGKIAKQANGAVLVSLWRYRRSSCRYRHQNPA